jgi:PAS domain S-box-containing protein
MPKQLEDYLRTTLASIGDAVISTDTAGLILFANKVALSLLRASESEILGQPLTEVLRLENEFTRKPVENPIERVLREGTVVGLANHTVLIARDGTEVPIDDSAAPILDEAGEIQGAVIVFKDITARRRAEAAGRLLASIVESSDDAIISKDIRGVITSWNRGAERIFGYSAAEVIGKSISILAAPDRLDEMPKILERIRNGERIDHYETVRRAKSGALVNISLTVSPLYDREGQFVGASKIARDITEQVRFRAELAEQRERLRVTLSSIGDAVIATNDTGMITYLNPVAEELTGWNSSAAIGRHLAEVFRIVNESSRRAVEDPAMRVIREGRTVGLANHTVLITRDGRERPIDDSAAPIHNQRGEITGVVLVFRDITRRRAAERKLQAYADDLQRANDELTQFAYAISHDLSEPLRNITNFAQLLVRETGPNSSPKAASFLQVIIEGVQRMQALLQDLLAYTQIGGLQQGSAAPVNTDAILRKTLADLKPAMDESGAEVTADPLPQVWGHGAQLSQVFQNLITNAIKYRSDRPPRVHVGVRKNEDGEWVFSVRDNGIGIEAQHHRSVFRVFKRLHGRDIPGTGMGLAICAKVVERHGGKIWVESEPGLGSEFLFTLPAESKRHIVATNS